MPRVRAVTVSACVTTTLALLSRQAWTVERLLKSRIGRPVDVRLGAPGVGDYSRPRLALAKRALKTCFISIKDGVCRMRALDVRD